MPNEEYVPLGEYLQRSIGTDLDIRIGIQDDNEGWLNRTVFDRTEDRVDAYIVKANGGTPRYRMATTESGCQVIGRRRFSFPIVKLMTGGETSAAPPSWISSGRRIIVEISRGDLKAPAPPEPSETYLSISRSLLSSESEYGSIFANRVAGLDAEKQRLKRFLRPDQEDWGVAEQTGLLLEGPPGTGKTELVMAVCEELYGSIPVTISGPEILSKWVGESERLLREKFDEARQQEYPVLYIDELDAIAQSRSDTAESYSAQIVAQLLVLLDGVESKEDKAADEKPLKVIASTNLAEVVDPALRRPGRLGGRPIRFRRPTENERIAILHHYLEEILASADGELSPELRDFVTEDSRAIVEDLIKETKRCTGAEIEDVVQEAVQQARTDDGGEVTLDYLSESEILEESTGITEEEISVEELDNSALDEDISPGSYHLDEEDPKAVAKTYFQTQLGEKEDKVCLYREVEPRDVLTNDVAQIREEVAHAFQHRSEEEVVIVLQNGQLLAQTQSHSQQVSTLIDVLNEQLIQFHDEVLVLIPGAGSETVIPETNT